MVNYIDEKTGALEAENNSLRQQVLTDQEQNSKAISANTTTIGVNTDNIAANSERITSNEADIEAKPDIA